MKISNMIAVFFCGFLIGCTAPEQSRRALEDAGFTDIQVGGYDYWSCGEDDDYSTKFVAKNPKGKKVEGTVCCGLMKSCTIRF